MSDSFEQSVLARLDDLKNDVNRASDRHEAGLKKLFDLHETHVADDTIRFKTIDDQFTKAAVTAAEAKGTAKATARAWGLVAGIPVPLGTAIWAVWKALHRIP